MSKQLKYAPIFRVRQEELKVLKNFDFGDNIFPCIEIIKEVFRLAPQPRKGARGITKQKKIKRFEDDYLPLVESIKAKKIFIDFPVHLKTYNGMKQDTLSFLQTVVGLRTKRTEYMKKFIPLASKVIPVISTYFGRTNEQGSIILQEEELRPHFKIIAFRTFPDSFLNDIVQIEKIILRSDYLIMDWADTELDINDEDQLDVIERLKKVKCTVIVHRNPIAKGITNVGLTHTTKVIEIDNSLLEKYKDYEGTCFSDYSGIKKDEIGNGGAISPGFTFYDAVENSFYGYKGRVKELSEFETTIVPAVISSDASKRMQKHSSDYLGLENVGWRILHNINNGGESGQSAAKFKKIGMFHYLHCIKTKITNGDFN